ncbi:response regulator transcription factor [Lacrimispora sp.]|uniref:response regulator transcription factor n=1 Tax=Lacrimispora sp. TaxID=2719234 RepID=UPI0028A184E2|nr:response regulator [Lacrimispora sp.]
MLKILFVDDDAIARRNMAQRIDWNAYGWNLVYTARDGVDALEYMKEDQPDIVISDIKMPIMDGIEMARIARDYYPDLFFIFLSGYREFEYAKQALALDAIDYLNKPIDTDQLVDIVRRAEKKCLQTREINWILHEKYPLIQRQYISKLMYDNFREADDAIFRAFDINIADGLGMALFMDFGKAVPVATDKCQKFLQTLCNDLTRQYHGSLFICMDNLQLFIIYTIPDCRKQEAFLTSLENLKEYINNRLKQELNITGNFYLGSVIRELNDLYSSCQAAMQAKNSETYTLLFEIKYYIRENYWDTDLSLVKIARHFNINHCYLTSLYKDQFGINLYDYLIQVRMEKAGELLRTSDMRNYEAAEAIGYRNSQYFSASFKKYYGCTVKEYKHQHTGCKSR